MHEKDHASYRSPCLGAGSRLAGSVRLRARRQRLCGQRLFPAGCSRPSGRAALHPLKAPKPQPRTQERHPEAPAESADSSLPAYNADPLTGEPRRSNGRIVGVMVNNISNTQRQNARPQRGIGSADLLIESKVEAASPASARCTTTPTPSRRWARCAPAATSFAAAHAVAGAVLPRRRKRPLHQVHQRVSLLRPEHRRQKLF